MPKNKRLNVQVSIRGKGVSRLSPALVNELVNRVIDGDEPPTGIEVRIHIWRAGHEVTWNTDDPRSEGLKTMLRRLVQDGKIRASLRSD